MDQIPAGLIMFWVIVSGLCFLLSLILNAVLIFLALKAWGQIGPLVKDARDLVHNVGEKATSITTTAKSTVDNISTKTTHILGSAEDASAEVARKVSAASAAITAIFVVTRIVGALRGMQAQPQRAKK
jgi:hypothetical protein